MKTPGEGEAPLGWRKWRLLGGVLRSVGSEVERWRAGEPAVAECRFRDHAARNEPAPPSTGCHCGLYAARDLPALVRSGYDSGDADAHAWGTVRQWGKVLEFENGWRSQFAYPTQLYVLGDAGALRRDYGVPVLDAAPLLAEMDGIKKSWLTRRPKSQTSPQELDAMRRRRKRRDAELAAARLQGHGEPVDARLEYVAQGPWQRKVVRDLFTPEGAAPWARLTRMIPAGRIARLQQILDRLAASGVRVVRAAPPASELRSIYRAVEYRPGETFAAPRVGWRENPWSSTPT